MEAQIWQGREWCRLVLVSGRSSSPALPRVGAVLDYVRTTAARAPTRSGPFCGAAMAIANAVGNATGVRVREYPITLDKLLAKRPS
jgi:hypothetical protein